LIAAQPAFIRDLDHKAPLCRPSYASGERPDVLALWQRLGVPEIEAMTPQAPLETPTPQSANGVRSHCRKAQFVTVTIIADGFGGPSDGRARFMDNRHYP
jgi:hypothetical protein